MVVTSAPKWALIWPDGLTKLVPVITRICPGAPLEGSRAVSTGPPPDGGGAVVVVGAGTVVGEVAGGRLVGGVVAWGPGEAAGRLRGAGAEGGCEVVDPPPLIDDKVTSAAVAPTRATDMTRMARPSQRPRRPDAADPPPGEGSDG